MARFSGLIGFADLVEVEPGKWVEDTITRRYKGDLLRDTRRLNTENQLNDNINVSNEISIVADPYANQHFHSIRYVEFKGVKWKVSYVDASKRPRLILTLGGVYNGKQA